MVFDYANILEHLSKSKTNPADGTPMSSRDLVKLKFHKNSAGKYFCPITYKEFTQHSHIVAVSTSGNVYSYTAVKDLNFDAKNFTVPDPL
jgi:peptidyl-prolyl cis-trans isomerase-like protein 2